jgi:pimeloyl-ACP methyl ester carboxylesterase
MAERSGATVVEVPGASHSVYVAHPDAVADLIKRAAFRMQTRASRSAYPGG